MYIICYVHCLLSLVFFMSRVCYVLCLSCQLFVMSSVCYVCCLLCPPFIMYTVCNVQCLLCLVFTVCYVHCLSVQGLSCLVFVSPGFDVLPVKGDVHCICKHFILFFSLFCKYSYIYQKKVNIS